MVQDKCHECYVETFEKGKRWVMKSGGSYRHIMYCPDCGSPLAFDSDGNPVVGASYDELEKKAEALDTLEDAGLGCWRSTEGWVTELPNTQGEPCPAVYESLVEWGKALKEADHA